MPSQTVGGCTSQFHSSLMLNFGEHGGNSYLTPAVLFKCLRLVTTGTHMITLLKYPGCPKAHTSVSLELSAGIGDSNVQLRLGAIKSVAQSWGNIVSLRTRTRNQLPETETWLRHGPASCITSSNLIDPFDPPFPYSQGGEDAAGDIYLLGLRWGLNTSTPMKDLGQASMHSGWFFVLIIIITHHPIGTWPSDTQVAAPGIKEQEFWPWGRVESAL